MPNNNGTVGDASYPLAAGTADTPLADATIDGLLGYFAHWLNVDLNAKLANMTGVADEAVPSGSTYGYQPRAAFVRNSVPALYMWRETWTLEQRTLLRFWKRSEVKALWVFTSRELPHAFAGVEGLANAVADVLARATQQRAHITYQPTGWATGTDIMTALGLLALGPAPNGRFVTAGSLVPTPGQRSAMTSRAAGTDGHRQRAFPCVEARWEIVEEVGSARTLTDPDDVTREHLVGMYEDGASILDRYNDAPDGAEDL